LIIRFSTEISTTSTHHVNFARTPLSTIALAKLALIDQHSFWIYGYFEEHKLPLIHVGDPAEIRLLGNKHLLKGHVESIARGITDWDNPTDVTLLANVNPSFN
jgi:multidrug resistance efflux pump